MLQALGAGLTSVITILIMVAVGYLTDRWGWFPQGREQVLARMVVYIALPCTVFTSFAGSFTRADLLSMGWALGLPLAVTLLSALLATGLIRLLRLPEGRRSVFFVMFTFSNAVFIGVPVVVSLFGQEALPLTVATFMVNTSLFWTLGVGAIRREGARVNGLKPREEPWHRRILRALPPATIAFVLAIVAILLNLKLPKAANEALGYLGAMVSPVSLIYSGIIIHRVGLRGLRVDRGIAAVLLGRFLWVPLATLGLALLVPLPAMTEQVIIVQMSMPVMAQASIVAGLFGLDQQYAIRGFTLSTLLSFLMIPLYMVLFTLVY